MTSPGEFIAGYLVGSFAAAVAALWFMCVALGNKPQPRRARLRMYITPETFMEGEHVMARITNEQKVRIEFAPTTQAGNPAPVDGEVRFESSNPDVAVIERIDATSAFVLAVGAGATLITAAGDADMGEGVREVVATGALEVVLAEATNAEIVFGEPELQ